MVNVGIREKGVSGLFLQPNLKDLEHSLGTGRLDCNRQLQRTGDIVSFPVAGIN